MDPEWANWMILIFRWNVYAVIAPFDRLWSVHAMPPPPLHYEHDRNSTSVTDHDSPVACAHAKRMAVVCRLGHWGSCAATRRVWTWAATWYPFLINISSLIVWIAKDQTSLKLRMIYGCATCTVVTTHFDLFRFEVFSLRIIYLRNHRPFYVWLMISTISHIGFCGQISIPLCRVCVCVCWGCALRFTTIITIRIANLQGAKPTLYSRAHKTESHSIHHRSALFYFYELQNGACSLQCYTLRHMDRTPPAKRKQKIRSKIQTVPIRPTTNNATRNRHYNFKTKRD